MTKARGEGFFAAVETRPYQPRGVLLGQATDDSCVPACARMLLFDQYTERASAYAFSESFLRGACATGRAGSVIARVPEILRQSGLRLPYHYRTDLTLAELQAAITRAFAIAVVRSQLPRAAHVVIVEEMTADDIAIRDPLPRGRGSAYRVPLAAFEASWLSGQTGLGSAVIVIG